MVPFTRTHGHQCVNTCDAGCGAGFVAYNEREGAQAMMTLCPIFMSDPLDSRASTLVHEGSHGTVGLATDDHSYSWQRLITQLRPDLARKNADSYTALVRLLSSPESVTLGPDVPDRHFGGMTETEQGQVDGAVAWLQQWLIGTQSQFSFLYDAVNESRRVRSWSDTFYRGIMTDIADVFRLQWRQSPPPVPPHADQVAIAGIADRYQHLVDVFSDDPLTLTKVAAPETTWSVGPGGPGTAVRFGTDFFGQTQPRQRVETLLQKIIAADRRIGADRKEQYAGALRLIVARANIGTP